MNILAIERLYKIFFNIVYRFILSLLISASFITCVYSMQPHAEHPKEAESKIHKVYLLHHDFEFDVYTASPGDIIEIINQSDISHSVYIETPDETIINIDEKLYVQTPGVSVRWKVPESGEFTLRCWIHPIIHATLLISESVD
ncbi:MAG: hypothetical protein Q7V21_01000 [Methylophaga sp.]|nr:hypothetical protein [Methylophaga sp.]